MILTEVEEPITDRQFTDINLQGLKKECRNVKLVIWKDVDSNLKKIQPALRHLYLSGLLAEQVGQIRRVWCGQPNSRNV